MRKQTQQKLLGLLDSCTRKIQRAQKAGTRAAFIAVAQHAALIANVVRAELEPREQQEPLQVLGGVEQALNALPAAPDAALCRETAALLLELTGHLHQQVAQARTRKLIVFLPYKASMWDSLESIWMAADKDREHCQAMVVPIPYADRNPDGTAAQWHYEINQYPKYVPVIDHRSVDLEKLHPDVIFIHNPYDNYNAVTSVDMQYYSAKLKQYTDNLVYVPYFVVGDTISPHFCQTPGVINADHVIVQDENIKEQYERYYPGGNPPAGKFLALGSPKFDKFLGTTRADYTLPQSWQRIIGGRKVVLYNTSLTTMLNSTDLFCRKLRAVFAAFRRCNEVVLWWRPHPLMRATFKSMRPEYYDEYCTLERQYIEDGWGIYDDTPELERAIVCSNAYYGDLASSVVWLYRATGKPMLFQDYTQVCFQPFWFFGLATMPDASWLVKPVLRRGFLRILSQTGKVNLHQDFATPAIRGEDALHQSYFASLQVGHQFYLLPWESQDLYCYDMATRTGRHINLHLQGVMKSAMVICAHDYRGRLYCWGNGNELLEYDIQKQEVVASYKLPGIGDGDMDSYGRVNASAMQSSRLYLPHNQANGFIWFDCETKSSGFCRAGVADMRFIDLVVTKNQLWLLGRAPYLVRYDLHTGQWEQFTLRANRSPSLFPYFVDIFQQGDELLILPCCEYMGADEVIRYHMITGEMEIGHHPGGYITANQLPDGSVAAQDMQRMQIDIYKPDGSMREVPLQVSPAMQADWQNGYKQGEGQCFFERYDMPVAAFVQRIKKHLRINYGKEGNTGKQVYTMFA